MVNILLLAGPGCGWVLINIKLGCNIIRFDI